MGAVEPETGESFHLFMPSTTKVTFRIFVEELSKVYPNHKIVLIHDGAPWHQIESRCDNIELWQMPAYSPELNPIERLWKWIRENLLHNRFFDSLEELEQTLCQFLQDVSTLKQTILSVCTIRYKECSGE